MPAKNSKASSGNRQLSLFDSSQGDLPLPERIAIKYRFPLQKQQQNNVWLYAVPDWLRGVARTENPRQFWSEMKKRYPQLSTGCLQLKYTAADGKKYKVSFANAETLYIITANMGKTTGLRDDIVKYIAKAGVKIDEYLR